LLNSMGFTFPATIIFDGKNVTLSGFLVYQHPQLDQLAPLTPFIANKNLVLTIHGKALKDHGFTAKDITVTFNSPGSHVTLDNGYDVTMDDTSITCRPPPINVEHIRYPSTTGNNPAQPNVTVCIGQYSFPANQIQYVLDEPFNVIMSVMIAILAFIVIVSLVFGILTICRCGQPGRSLPSRDAVPYEQMEDDETRADKLGDLNSPRHRNNDSTIEVKSVRYKKTTDGVDNAGRSTDDFETMTL